MTFLAPLLLLAVLPAAAADPAELTYEVRFTGEKMTLDGHAHEKSWALAPAVDLTDRHYPGLMAIDSVSTRVKAVWNDKGLMVLYQCLDTDIQATVTERDGRVYTDDTVELFLDPDMDGTNYLQVAINPRSARRDLLISGAGRPDRHAQLGSGLRKRRLRGGHPHGSVGPGRVVDGGAVPSLERPGQEGPGPELGER